MRGGHNHSVGASASHGSAAGKENQRRSAPPGTPRIPLVGAAEYDTIPRYMIKARQTVAKLNEAVEALNTMYAEKYQILSMPPAKMKESVRRRYLAYKDAEAEGTEGYWFVTDDDIKQADTPALRLDTAGRAMLCMLRHLGRLQEHRSKGVTRYIMLG